MLALPTVLSAQVWEVDNQLILTPLIFGQPGGEWGYAFAVGDFNGDGLQDFMTSGPHLDGFAPDNGFWAVYFGSASRTLAPADWFDLLVSDNAEGGTALATGAFDADGLDHVAVGLPLADVDAFPTPYTDAGMVRVYNYHPGTQSWDYHQITEAYLPSANLADGNHFGAALAAGDFNGDGHDDLAIGAPLEDVGGDVDEGVVDVCYADATSGSLGDCVGDTIISPYRVPYDRFGTTLAAGDFNGDGIDDLAVGVPYRTVDGLTNAGGVEIYYGSATGLLSSPQILDAGSFAATSVSANAHFGQALAAGTFDKSYIYCGFFGPCADDLAIGIPGQDLVFFSSAGQVIVVDGGSSGLDTGAVTSLTASSVGVTLASYIHFGSALAAGELDGDPLGAEDLAIDTPTASYYAPSDGVVSLVFGDISGLNAGRPAQVVPERPGFAVAPAGDGDEFGTALAIADLDGDGVGDLLVGDPLKGSDDEGAVQVLYGALFADGFDSGGTGNWSSATP